MQHNTSRLKISDLSYCELAAEEEAEITGGFLLVRGLPLYRYLTEQALPLLPPDLEDYGKKLIYSEPGTIVNKLENPQTGSGGVEMLTNNGNAKSHSIVLTEGNSMIAFSTSVVFNSSDIIST
ncbi:hypothetical protein NIES2101_14435 [Calothrix sp. HK-06]|nr:hypothetical protein NIES2101_14435 [Calothrix sp. HK-06]